MTLKGTASAQKPGCAPPAVQFPACCSAFLHWTCCQTSNRVAAWSQPQAQAQDVCKLSCLTAIACLSIDCTVCSLSNCEDAQSSLGLGPDTADVGAVNIATLGPYAAPPSGMGLQGHLASGSAAQAPPHGMAGTLTFVNSWYGHFTLPERCCFSVLHQAQLAKYILANTSTWFACSLPHTPTISFCITCWAGKL